MTTTLQHLLSTPPAKRIALALSMGFAMQQAAAQHPYLPLWEYIPTANRMSSMTLTNLARSEYTSTVHTTP